MLRQALLTSSRALRSSPCSSLSSRAIRQQRICIPAALSLSQEQGRIRQAARWYSAEAQTKADDGAAEPAKASSEASPEAEAPGAAEQTTDAAKEVQKQLESKDAEARDWKDKYLRSVADFRNLQDRTARDTKAARDFAIQVFAKDLVDSVDDLGRALSTVPEEQVRSSGPESESDQSRKDLVNLYEGIRMTEQNLLKTLAKHGLVRFDPAGEKFNPNEHEALFQTPMAGKEDGSVFHTQQAGFKLNGRIIRAAKVGVVKNS